MSRPQSPTPACAPATTPAARIADGRRRVMHCSHWGAYRVVLEGDRIAGIEPFEADPMPSPILGSVPDWIGSPLRITQPVVRQGWLAAWRAGRPPDGRGRGAEPFVPVSWDEALDIVAAEIDRIRHRHGNASIFAGSYGWASCGRFHHAAGQMKRLLNLVGGHTGHVDTYSVAAGQAILRLVVGDTAMSEGQATTLDDLAAHCDLLLVLGAMSPRTAQNESGGIGRHMLGEHLKAIAARGTRIVHVSPCRDDMPEGLGAEWLPIRPNTDAALLLALAREVVRAGGHDSDFLARCTSGAEEFLDHLAGNRDGVEKTADWAAGITGLSAATICTLALALAQSRSFVAASWSLQRAHHGEQPYWAAIGLAATLGQIGLPGGGVGFGIGSLGGVGAPFALTLAPAIPQGHNPTGSFIPVARIADLLTRPGETFSYEGRTHSYPDIRMIYWAGGNPFHHHQDLNRLAEAWTRPETIVVQDPMWTATALRADIVLPASTSLERNDIAASRRSDLLVAMQQAVPPQAGARSDHLICAGLAQRLGVGAAFTEGRDEMGWLRHLYEITRQDAASRFGQAMPDFDSFWHRGHTTVPVRAQNVHLADFRADPAGNPLSTETGRIMLSSPRLDALGLEDCPPRPSWLPPAEWLGNAGPDELHLISRQPEGRLHSQLEQGRTSRALNKRAGRETVTLNPGDAAARGIAEGQGVRLWNARGACLATAALSDALRPGVAVLPTGAWYAPIAAGGTDLSGNPNVLTADIPSSAYGQGCAAHSCLVRVAPWQGNEPEAAEAYLATLKDRLPVP
ncbi:MAG: molybdopterin-dependent oxidoreductase [Rhodobacteraceae bacterium]|jgi:biotin/methionine sulfoxide reductase|nr:molybdopterin-dependent oxidoreductase [Paracoccaceae bacterium]